MEDIIERMESAAERRFDEITKGLPEGKFRCGCGNIGDLSEWTHCSYLLPVCEKCLKDIKKQAIKTWIEEDQRCHPDISNKKQSK